MEYTVEFRKSVVINQDVIHTIVVFSCEEYKDSLRAIIPLVIDRWRDGFSEYRFHEYYASSRKYYSEDYVIHSIIDHKDDSEIGWSHP